MGSVTVYIHSSQNSLISLISSYYHDIHEEENVGSVILIVLSNGHILRLSNFYFKQYLDRKGDNKDSMGNIIERMLISNN